MQGLTGADILRIVNNYIGVDGGYLVGFSYRGLEEFYTLSCDLTINPYEYGSTTRERFIGILQKSEPHTQARILRGLLEKVPEPTAKVSSILTRSAVQALIERLEGLPVPDPTLEDVHTTVERALADARVLLERSEPVSAVDRIHTALYGYLKGICREVGITHSDDDSLARLLKLLREGHPKLQAIQAHSDEVWRVLLSLGTVVDSIGTLRNRASLAHANEELIGDAEAMLVVNAGRSILHYLEAKLR